MSHNPYIYIFIMANGRCYIFNQSVASDRCKKTIHKSICKIISLLCAVCNAFGYDFSRNYQCYAKSDSGSNSLCGRSCGSLV